MIKPREFLEYLERNEIPPSAPIGTSEFGVDWSILDLTGYEIREAVRRQHMMFALVTKEWTKPLAEWIGARRCLEIMAGAGWLSKALSEFGVDIRATDDFSWTEHHANTKDRGIFPVERLNATKAIRQYPDVDVLIVSWPPYRGTQLDHAMRAWGRNRPIVYIGERIGGCTGTDYFYEHFRELDDAPDISLMCWPGLHDYITIGEWTGPED